MYQRHKKPIYNPDHTPARLAIYDNGGQTVDRYTVIFTHKKVHGYWFGVCSSEGMYVSQWLQDPYRIDQPSYKHLGKKITFAQMPDCKLKNVILAEYKDIWHKPNPNQ